MSNAIEFEGVSKEFGDFKAVSDLSFKVKSGAITGFLGPNGAGKTTSVRMMLGLATQSQGRVSVLGGEAGRFKDKIGFLPEERGLYRKMTALEVIVFLAGLKGVPSGVAKKRAMVYLEAQGLGKFAKEQVKNLSKGMSQKVQLISTLVHEPDLLILDEPFSGLDPVNQEGLEAVIREAASRGASVLFSTHVMTHAERLCENVILLAKGQKVFDGSLEQAKACAPRYIRLKGILSAAFLSGLSGIVEVAAITPDEVALKLASDASVPQTLKAIFASSMVIDQVSVDEPSLHDAFIVLTRGAAHV